MAAKHNHGCKINILADAESPIETGRYINKAQHSRHAHNIPASKGVAADEYFFSGGAWRIVNGYYRNCLD